MADMMMNALRVFSIMSLGWILMKKARTFLAEIVSHTSFRLAYRAITLT